MIKRSLLVSITSQEDPTEIVLTIKTTTDGSNNLILENTAPKLVINSDELTLAIGEAKAFMRDFKAEVKMEVQNPINNDFSNFEYIE